MEGMLRNLTKGIIFGDSRPALETGGETARRREDVKSRGQGDKAARGRVDKVSHNETARSEKVDPIPLVLGEYRQSRQFAPKQRSRMIS